MKTAVYFRRLKVKSHGLFNQLRDYEEDYKPMCVCVCVCLQEKWEEGA